MMIAIGEPMVLEWRTPADDLGAVGFDLHAAAAAESLLPPPQLAIDGVERHWDPRRKSRQGRNKALSMGFSGSLETQHLKLFMVPAGAPIPPLNR